MTARSLLTASLVVFASAVVAAQTSHVTGTVAFRERIALPPTAVVYVTLEDVSRADTQSLVVAATRIAGPNQPPIPFDLAFDGRRINPAHRYAVRARIVDGDRLMFTTAETVPVITQGHGNEADVMLRFVAGPKPVTPPPAPAIAPAPPPPPSPRRMPPPPALRLPATFTGTLPCADCAGQSYRLNLFPDDSYFLRTTSVGRTSAPVDEIGSWALSSDERVVVLGRSRGEQELFEIRDANTLRKLDMNGEPIGSRVANELRRSPAFQMVDVRLPMRGAYRSMADAGRFTECSTGQEWAVESGGASRDVEAAYAKLGAKGEPVLVALEGHVTIRPKVEGTGTERTLSVDRFIEPRSGDMCAPRFAGASLSGTDWRLTQLDGRTIARGATPRGEASLALSAGSMQFSGSTGCNRLIGTYDVAGDGISFSSGGTLMACPGQGDTEKAFMTALEHARTYRVLGRLLEFRDADGKVVARFEAAPDS